MRARPRLLTLAALLLCGPGFAQDVVYPAQGQSPEQQNKDKGECHVWATNEAGFDPTQTQAPPQTLTQQVAKQPVTGSGARGRGAARGAAVGATAGAIGGDAGEGAAKGAAAGAMVGGMKHRQQNRATPDTVEQPNPAYQEWAASNDRYMRAVKACLSARGYTVQ